MSGQTIPAAVQFVVDADGRKTAVILPIEEYEEMLEDLHLGRVARESKNEPRRPFAEVVEEMRSAGEIDV
jgi:PHD/YefM family antitoxin component YafN of YafNO toxin-antitoxin module